MHPSKFFSFRRQGHPGHADHADHCHRRHARGDTWVGGERGGHHRGGHGGPGHGRGGRLGRLFAHGDLQYILLHLIAEKPRHGYELIKALEDMTGGAYTPSPGTIYPALTLLEEQGYLSVQTSDGNKKLHSITADGQSYLTTHQGAVEILLARIAQAGADREDARSPRIVRAVENLKLALALRLSQGALTEAQIEAVVSALDQAAGAIERA